MQILINKYTQIRDPFLLSGLISSGFALSVSGDFVQISGTSVFPTTFTQTGHFGQIDITGAVISPFLSGLLQTTVVGSGNIYYPSIVDVSGNNLNYYLQISTGDLTLPNVVLSSSTTVTNAGWQFLTNGAWVPFPVLGLTSAQQQSAIVRYEFVASGLSPSTPYYASVLPVFAGNNSGQFFDSAKFYPDSQGFQVALVPSFKQVFDNIDSRYVIKQLINGVSVISGAYTSGTPIYLQSTDGGFPTDNLGSGRIVWNNASTGLFVYGSGIGFTGWRLINDVISVTGISGVNVSNPTGNVVISLSYGTGSGQPPSGNDLRFFSSYHQSGSPDPLNIGGLSGVAATGQRINVYNQGTYVSSFPNLAFSGRGVTVSGDSLNNRDYIILNYIKSLQGNNIASPLFTDADVRVLGTGTMLVSGVQETGSNTNILYIYDTGTTSVASASGITYTGAIILSGAGNTTVYSGPITSSGQVVVISGSSTAGGGSSAGNVTGIGLNNGPFYTGAFGFSGAGGITTLLTNLGVGVSGIVISGTPSSSVGGVTGFSANNGPLLTGAFSISGSGAVTVTLQNFGNGISGFVINTDHLYMELFNTIGY